MCLFPDDPLQLIRDESPALGLDLIETVRGIGYRFA
jgi:DNA-binding response OmpR family regulator